MTTATNKKIISTIPWVLTAGLYSKVFYELYHERWALVDYGHAYFILPVSLLIVWLKRDQLKTLARNTGDNVYLPGLLLILLGLFLFVFGWRWDYLLIQTISLFPLVFGLASFFYGPTMFRPLLFPMAYLILLVPPPIGVLDSITLPMRHFASLCAEIILKTFHYPVSREGLLLQLGGHEIFMGAPCSGFRSLVTMFSLGLIYIYFYKGSFAKNLILLLAIAPLAIFGNMIRVITICLITFYFGDAAGQGFLHDFSGMFVFLIMILGLMGLEKLLRDKKQ